MPPCPGRWDYPRVRGGTGLGVDDDGFDLGLSPRARGNPDRVGRAVLAHGTIPACAGEPCWCPGRGCKSGDYPRVRGGTLMMQPSRKPRPGLSPRARGNPFRSNRPIGLVGTIPACAGEPTGRHRGSVSQRDYPRVRGGTALKCHAYSPFRGLSPRARGNLRRSIHQAGILGTIPACAGEPRSFQPSHGKFGDYPRVRGGTEVRSVTRYADTGLSPRARGNLGAAGASVSYRGTIPACAGEPSNKQRASYQRRDYPRVRRGTDECRTWIHSRPGLSPRARGNLGGPFQNALIDGTIPACAGEPPRRAGAALDPWDYPRVRGGT